MHPALPRLLVSRFTMCLIVELMEGLPFQLRGNINE